MGQEDPAAQKKYAFLLSELENAKQQILAIKESQVMQVRTQLFERRPVPRDYKPGIDWRFVAEEAGKIYGLEEMKRTVKSEAEDVQRQYESEAEQMTVLKALMANVTRNRIKITREFLAPDSVLSIQRKLSMAKIKENLDQQAISVDERQKLQTETIQALKLREKMLQKCQVLIDKAGDSPDTELQRAFERYVSIYKRPAGPRRK